MTFRVLALIVLAAATLSANADFRTVQRAYEIALNDFQAPATLNGKLTFRECSSCEQRSVRVDANTRYELNNERIDLQEFRKQILKVSNRDTKLVIVLHHLESDIITAVSATL